MTILVLVCCLVIVRRLHIWSSGYQTTYDSKTKIVVFYSLTLTPMSYSCYGKHSVKLMTFSWDYKLELNLGKTQMVNVNIVREGLILLILDGGYKIHPPGFLALSIFITRDVITHCYSSRNKSVTYVNTWGSLSLLHTGYKNRHCRIFLPICKSLP